MTLKKRRMTIFPLISASLIAESHDVFGQVFPEKRYGVFPAGHGFFEELVVGVVHFLALSVPMHQCKNHPYRTAET